MTKLYLAYGANTNFESMQRRCPAAKYICNLTLNHHQMVFRKYADVVASRGKRVECALWLLTPECEASLDRFEGFPRSYVKKYVRVQLEGAWHRVMFYVMRRTGYQELPPLKYEETLRKGYEQCGLPIGQIDKAMNRAALWEQAHPVVEQPKSSSAKPPKGQLGLFNGRPIHSARWARDRVTGERFYEVTTGAAAPEGKMPVFGQFGEVKGYRDETMAERERRFEKTADDFMMSVIAAGRKPS